MSGFGAGTVWIGIGKNERTHTTVKQPCGSNSMNHASSCEIMVRFERKTAELYSKRRTYRKNWSSIQSATNCTSENYMHFFSAIHVSKGFGRDTATHTFLIFLAPKRPLFGPDTVPIRPPECIFPKIQPRIFWKNRNYKELIEKIRGEEYWIELSWFVLLLRAIRGGRMGGFVWKWKSAKPNILKIFFWRHAFGKKAAWKQRRWLLR